MNVGFMMAHMNSVMVCTVIYSSFVYWCLDEGSGASSALALCTGVWMRGPVRRLL